MGSLLAATVVVVAATILSSSESHKSITESSMIYIVTQPAFFVGNIWEITKLVIRRREEDRR